MPVPATPDTPTTPDAAEDAPQACGPEYEALVTAYATGADPHETWAAMVRADLPHERRLAALTAVLPRRAAELGATAGAEAAADGVDADTPLSQLRRIVHLADSGYVVTWREEFGPDAPLFQHGGEDDEGSTAWFAARLGMTAALDVDDAGGDLLFACAGVYNDAYADAWRETLVDLARTALAEDAAERHANAD
ncbi:hypothetical protein [Saccharothrix sp. HUAS TT1]|uniref:hypothetical protein n=1 Tax=unclassified Saccharothrix TaxID=2593673 RepID=UPI00345B6761